MKLERFLREEQYEFSSAIDDELSIVTKNCSRIIKAYKSTGSFFYRGAKGHPTFQEKKGRLTTVRKPKDTPAVIHRFLNILGKEIIGWKFRDGIPASTLESQAKGYSGYEKNVYIIFPHNKFKIAWHPKIYDLFSHLRSELRYKIFFDQNTGKFLKPAEQKKAVEKYRKELEDIVRGYITDGPEVCLRTHRGEVFFRTGKYYLINSVFENTIRDQLVIGKT